MAATAITRAYASAVVLYTNSAVVTTEVFSGDIDLETSGHAAAHCDLAYQGSLTLTDLIVSIYASLDGTNYDVGPTPGANAISSFTAPVNASTTAQRISFVVPDLLHFRVGLKSNSTVTTTTSFASYSVTLTHQRWNWQVG
jgi:hypothetical protein